MGVSRLTLSGVGVRYGAHWAVRGVDLEVEAGSCTAIVGPSGAGKSSLLLAVNRLHELDPQVSVEGTVHLGPVDVATVDPQVLRRRVGLLFQQPTPFPLSIHENVAFALRAHGTPRTSIQDEVERALRKAALWDEVKLRLHTPASALSGGQQQRLCLARALALKPEVLLLDEPCAALDPAATMRVEAALRDLSVTTLIVTHNLGQARRLASHCVCLWPGEHGGERVAWGPIGPILAGSEHPGLRSWLDGSIG